MEEDDDLTQLFNKAADQIPKFTSILPPDQLLEIYALYKQATTGPCNIPKPRFYEIQAKTKWESWMKLGEMSKREAQNRYIEIVRVLDPDFFQNSETKKVSSLVNNDSVLSDSDKTIFDFCKENNLSKLAEVLRKNPSLIEASDSSGMRLIHWAADRGNLLILQYLVEQNAHVDAKDAEGQTALHYAASCDYLDCLKFLLEHGASPHACDNDGLKAAGLATDSQILQLLKEFM